jgi:hypothetical protein
MILANFDIISIQFSIDKYSPKYVCEHNLYMHLETKVAEQKLDFTSMVLATLFSLDRVFIYKCQFFLTSITLHSYEKVS